MMATFGEIIAQVANDLARTNINSEIGDEVNNAIRFYDTKRVWFNEKRDLTFSTVIGQEEYTSAANADIPNLIKIDGMFTTLGSTDKWVMTPMDAVWREWLTPPNDPGRPTHYTNYNRVLRLWPVPDAVYTVRVMGWYRLAALSVDADENIWTQEASDLVRMSAKRRVLANVVQDYEAAAAVQALEREAWDAVERETILRTGSGQICPTAF
jgi:hypothetical protein